MRTRTFIYLLVIVALVTAGITYGIVSLYQTTTVTINEGADKFLTALKNGQLDVAYGLLAPEFQATVNQELFNGSFTDADVLSWTYRSNRVQNGSGRLTGSIMMRGTTYSFELDLRQSDDSTWLVTRYVFAQ